MHFTATLGTALRRKFRSSIIKAQTGLLIYVITGYDKIMPSVKRFYPCYPLTQIPRRRLMIVDKTCHVSQCVLEVGNKKQSQLPS